VTKLAEVTTVKFTVWHFFGTDYVFVTTKFYYSGRQ